MDDSNIKNNIEHSKNLTIEKSSDSLTEREERF